MTTSKQWKERILALAAAAALSLLSSVPVLAENTVMLTIVADGALRAGIVDGSMRPVRFSNKPQVDTGELRLVVSDPRGSSAGWSVSIASSDFVYEGESPIGRDIPVSGFRMRVAADPVVIAGQPREACGPHAAPSIEASLDVLRTVLWACQGAGSGDYEQIFVVLLDIPAGSQAGCYVATLTVALTSAP